MAATVELSPGELQILCQRYLTEGADKDFKGRHPGDLKILSCEWLATSDAPAGFLGQHRFLKVRVKLPNGEASKELSFFAKSAPIGIASRMDYLESFGVFKKEIKVYRNVLPELQRIIPDFTPKCYYADNNLLIFENLGDMDFKMAASRDGLLDYEHLACALKSVASMHAASLIYESRTGKSVAQVNPKAVLENAYPLGVGNEHMRRQNFNNGVLVMQELLKHIPKFAEQKEAIIAEIPQKMERMFELAQQSKKYKNVFSHGDLWANNLMFRYGKYGGIPNECRLVDFQLARYAPAILDVITVLTIPTSKEFRRKHLDELLTDYYRFMTEFLKRERLSIEDFLTEQEFFASAQEFRICGLIESFLFSHLTLLPPAMTQSLTGSADGFSDFFERKRVTLCLQAFRTDRIYRDRLTDMIEDLVDRFIVTESE